MSQLLHLHTAGVKCATGFLNMPFGACVQAVLGGHTAVVHQLFHAGVSLLEADDEGDHAGTCYPAGEPTDGGMLASPWSQCQPAIHWWQVTNLQIFWWKLMQLSQLHRTMH